MTLEAIGPLGGVLAVAGEQLRLSTCQVAAEIEASLRVEPRHLDGDHELFGLWIERNVDGQEVALDDGTTRVPRLLIFREGAPGRCWVADDPDGLARALCAAAPDALRQRLADAFLARGHVDVTYGGARFDGPPVGVLEAVRAQAREAQAQQNWGNALQFVHAMTPGATGVWAGKPFWEPGQLVFLYLGRTNEVPRDRTLGLFEPFAQLGVPADLGQWAGHFAPHFEPRYAQGGVLGYVGLVTSRAVTRSGPFGGLRNDVVGVIPLPEPITLRELTDAVGAAAIEKVRGLQGRKLLDESRVRALVDWLARVRFDGHALQQPFVAALQVLDEARRAHAGDGGSMAWAVHRRWADVAPADWGWS